MWSLVANLLDIYWVLAVLPIQVTSFVLFFLCIGVLHLGRWKYENLSYNISMASEIGDFSLICAVMVAVEDLQHHSSPLSSWLGWPYQSGWLVISTLIGLVWERRMRPPHTDKRPTKMDTYHNVFVAPLLIFLLAMSAPIVWMYGDSSDKWMFHGFIAVWLCFLAYDAATGRLDQPKWMAKRGIELPLGLPWDEHCARLPGRCSYGD